MYLQKQNSKNEICLLVCLHESSHESERTILSTKWHWRWCSDDLGPLACKHTQRITKGHTRTFNHKSQKIIFLQSQVTENTKITSQRQIIMQIQRSQSFLFGHHISQTIPLSQVTDLFSAFSKSQTLKKPNHKSQMYPSHRNTSCPPSPFPTPTSWHYYGNFIWSPKVHARLWCLIKAFANRSRHLWNLSSAWGTLKQRRECDWPEPSINAHLEDMTRLINLIIFSSRELMSLRVVRCACLRSCVNLLL